MTQSQATLRASSEVERLLPQKEPRRAKSKISARKRAGGRKLTFCGVREEALDETLGLQAGKSTGLDKTSLGERNRVVDEVPVRRSGQPDIRLKDEDAAASPKQTGGDAQLLDHGLPRAEMLEIVTHEDDVEVALRKMVQKLEPVCLDESDVLRQITRNVAKIGSPLLTGRDVANEVATIARKVEHDPVLGDEALEEAAYLTPDFALSRSLSLTKPLAVNEIEGGRPCRSVTRHSPLFPFVPAAIDVGPGCGRLAAEGSR